MDVDAVQDLDLARDYARFSFGPFADRVSLSSEIDGGSTFLHPYMVTSADPPVSVVLDAGGTPTAVRCDGSVRLTVDGGRPVATAPPRSIAVEADVRTKTITVRGPKGKLSVKVAGAGRTRG
jgi:hypothetical protein